MNCIFTTTTTSGPYEEIPAESLLKPPTYLQKITQPRFCFFPFAASLSLSTRHCYSHHAIASHFIDVDDDNDVVGSECVCVYAEVAAAVAQKNNHYVWQIIMMRVSMYPMINESKINAAIE